MAAAIIVGAFCSTYPQSAEADDGKYTSGQWTAETIALDKASTAARNYAEHNNGVGILIHLGQDVPNHRVENGDELGALFVERFAELGFEAQYWYWKTSSRATGLTYHIGHLLYEVNGEPVIGLQTAWDDAPKVIKELELVKQLPR